MENTAKKRDELDDLLGLDEDVIKPKKILEESISANLEVSEASKIVGEKDPVSLAENTENTETIVDDIEKLASGSDDSLPSLVFGSIKASQDYINVADRILLQYKFLPVLKYDEIYKELAQLSVKSCPTPTLPVLNLELEKVQAAKDRLSEIFIDVVKSHSLKKRAVDILKDSWARFSETEKSSADKRKSESAFIVSNFEIDFAMTEALLKASMHVLKNLDSLHDNLSRRVTVIQLQLKLYDFGRSALPDFNFDKTNTGELTEEITGEKNDRDRERGDGITGSGMFESGEQ